jgi:hypothetical protein
MRKIRIIEVRGAFTHVWELQARERKFLLAEIMQVKGLMPLLMKPRNKQKWNPEDKAELRAHLKRLSHISPYIAVMILPGSFVMLPVLAWWLDRRRKGAPEQRKKFDPPPNLRPAVQATVQLSVQSSVESSVPPAVQSTVTSPVQSDTQPAAQASAQQSP